MSVAIVGPTGAGKSTLINTLAGRAVARTGDEPAVTKSQQLIKLDDDIMLYDTPGDEGWETLRLQVGDHVTTLVSLSLTPLRIEDALRSWDGRSEQVPCDAGKCLIVTRFLTRPRPG